MNPELSTLLMLENTAAGFPSSVIVTNRLVLIGLAERNSDRGLAAEDFCLANAVAGKVAG